MTRFALALIAILLLAFSASFTHTQLDPAGAGRSAAAVRPLVGGQALAANAGMARQGEPQSALTATLAAPPGDDRPAPALLIYLVLVLVGSVVSVAIVRRTQGRKI